MKTLVKKSHAETGDLQVNKFKGRLNAKAFRLLTDDLYSDKIKALVRELSTNANDSEKEAGNSGNFEVHLPTLLQPYFYIRDYGTGMSPEMIVETYTVFFESTKDDSNEFTGCLGLGSKTPLHYNTKSCTVNSWHGGMHYIYSCFMGNDGCPAYVELSRKASDEPNGVKVEFPVNKNDIESFYDRAKEVYKWFDHSPKFIGKTINIEKPEYTITGNGWSLSNCDAGVLMGGILYPIEVGKNKELDKYNRLINSGLILKANIGDVEFNMSREHLSYSSYTVHYLVSKFEEIKAEYATVLQLEIDKCTSYFDAQKKFNEISHNKLTNIFGVRAKDMKFNGVELKETINCFGMNCLFYRRHHYNKTLHKVDIHNSNHTIVNISSGLILVVNEAKVGCVTRISKYIDNIHSNGNGYNVFIFPTKESAKQSFKCEDKDLILSSDLPVTERSKRIGVKRGSIGHWPVYTSHHLISKCWENKNVDISVPGYYIIRNSYSVRINNHNCHPRNLNSLIEQLNIIGQSNVNIIGCPPNREKDLIKAGWINIQDKILDIKNDPKYKQAYIDQSVKSYIRDKFGDLTDSGWNQPKINTNIDLIQKIDDSLCDDIKRFKALFKEIHSSFTKNTSYKIQHGLFLSEIDVLKKAADVKLEEFSLLRDKIKNKYPLLNAAVLDSIKADLLEPYIRGIQNVSGKN